MQLYRTLRYITWRALGFWNVVSVTTDGLLITALILRILGLALPNDPRSEHWHLLSFQVLSCVAPFIWYVTFTPKVDLSVLTCSQDEYVLYISLFDNDMVFIATARIGHGRRWLQDYRNNADLHFANVPGVYYFLLGECPCSLLPPMSSCYFSVSS
jgi:hypothetical protein